MTQWSKPVEGSWTEHYPELGTGPISFRDSTSPAFYELEKEAVFKRAGAITEYKIVDAPDIDLGRIGQTKVGEMTVDVIDPVADYALLMEQLIDFEAIAALFRSGFRMRFDALSAITGPYAKAILEDRLGAPAGTVVGGVVVGP